MQSAAREADEDDKPIWGAENIAAVIERSVTQTQYLLRTGKLPGVNKVGDRYVTTRRKLLAALLGDAA